MKTAFAFHSHKLMVTMSRGECVVQLQFGIIDSEISSLDPLVFNRSADGFNQTMKEFLARPPSIDQTRSTADQQRAISKLSRNLQAFDNPTKTPFQSNWISL